MYLELEGSSRRMAFLSAAEQLACKANDHTELSGTLDKLTSTDDQLILAERLKDIAALERILAGTLREAADLIAKLESKKLL